MTDFHKRLLEFFKIILHNTAKRKKASSCDYSPDQPRDKDGRWTNGGFGIYDKPSGLSLNKKGEKTLDSSERKRYDEILIGEKTSDGIKITRISSHAYDRAAQRLISPGEIRNVIKLKANQSRRDISCRYYQNSSMRVIVDHDNGVIVTVMRRESND